MEKIPLELYETAYRLHYTENRIDEAVAYYQKLIKEFPDSNECGYAVIQLQKIKAQNVAESLQSSSKTPKLTLILISLCIISLVGLFLGLSLLNTHFNKLVSIEKKRVSTALNALGKHLRGEDKEALQLLQELKEVHSDDIFPYEMSSDIYRKQHKWDESRNEYSVFFKNNPERKPTVSETKYMFFDEKTIITTQPPKFPVIRNQRKKTPVTNRKQLKKKTYQKKIPKNPTPPPQKKGKGLFIVDPDSISYF